MHAPERTRRGGHRTPLSTPCSRRAHASAASEQSEKCQAYSAAKRRFRGDSLSPFGLVPLIICLFFSSPTLLYSVCESLERHAGQSATAHPPDRGLEWSFETQRAVKHLGRAIAHDTALAYKKAKVGGSRMIQQASAKTLPIRQKMKAKSWSAYMSALNTSAAAATAVQNASRKTGKAAQHAWTAVTEVPGKLWKGTGTGMQRLGGWMLGHNEGK